MQEERLTTLEKNVEALQNKTARAIVEVDENTTILLGVIRHQGQDLSRISERLDQVDKRLSQLETTLDEHTGLLTQILEKLNQKE